MNIYSKVKVLNSVTPATRGNLRYNLPICSLTDINFQKLSVMLAIFMTH